MGTTCTCAGFVVKKLEMKLLWHPDHGVTFWKGPEWKQEINRAVLPLTKGCKNHRDALEESPYILQVALSKCLIPKNDLLIGEKAVFSLLIVLETRIEVVCKPALSCSNFQSLITITN